MSNDKRPPEPGSVEARRAKARRAAVVLGLLAAALYVGFILYGWFEGIFPG